jgi:hypothetical protein
MDSIRSDSMRIPATFLASIDAETLKPPRITEACASMDTPAEVSRAD